MFRLFAIVDPQARIKLSPFVAADLRQFISAMEHEVIDLRAMGIQGITVPEILSALENIFL